jgi:uncharacterized phage protein gp47/JayE
MPRSRRAGERNLKNENGTKLRAQFIFDAATRAQLNRIACHKGCSVTSLIREWAASAEGRITHQLSGKALSNITMANRQIVTNDRGYQV